MTFVPPATCGGCAEDPGPELDEELEPPPAPPRGCLSTEDQERWYVALAKKSEADAERVRKHKGKDFHDEAAIAKHRELALKAMRAAADLSVRREDDALVSKREKRLARRDGAAARGAAH